MQVMAYIFWCPLLGVMFKGGVHFIFQPYYILNECGETNQTEMWNILSSINIEKSSCAPLPSSQTSWIRHPKTGTNSLLSENPSLKYYLLLIKIHLPKCKCKNNLPVGQCKYMIDSDLHAFICILRATGDLQKHKALQLLYNNASPQD